MIGQLTMTTNGRIVDKVQTAIERLQALTNKSNCRIPAEIAEKLGIKPKEDT